MSNLRAFCPASRIVINYVETLEAFIGERPAFLITKVEGGRQRYLSAELENQGARLFRSAFSSPR